MRDYTHKVKTKHRKAVQSSLRAKIHTIVKKKKSERESEGRNCIPLRKNKYVTFKLYQYSSPANNVFCLLKVCFLFKKQNKQTKRKRGISVDFA